MQAHRVGHLRDGVTVRGVTYLHDGIETEPLGECEGFSDVVDET